MLRPSLLRFARPRLTAGALSTAAPMGRGGRRVPKPRKPSLRDEIDDAIAQYSRLAPPAKTSSSSSTLQRVSKLLSQRGVCSRREADEFIEAGRVTVDGRVAKLGEKCEESAVIELDDTARGERARKVTVVLNKPLGVVSGQPEIVGAAEEEGAGRPAYAPAVSLLTAANWHARAGGDPLRFEPRHLKKLGTCGRLDVSSTGLLVLSQRGDLAKTLLSTSVEKEYLVRIDGETLAESTVRQRLDKLRAGIQDEGQFLTVKSVDLANENQLKFVLTEGKKRHLRRMCAKVGFKVQALKRVRIGHVALADLPVGKWRFLGADESFV